MIKNSSVQITKKITLLMVIVFSLLTIVGTGKANAFSGINLYPSTGNNSYLPSSSNIKLHLSNYGQVKSKLKCVLGEWILEVNTKFPGTAQAANPVTNLLLPYCPPTNTGGDSEPPSSVTVTTAVYPTYVSISWTEATDNVGVDKYDIYIDGEKLTSTTSTSYILERDCGVFSNVMIAAVDAAGNFSTSAIIGVPSYSCDN